jgi:hypothetical protein
MVRPFVKSGSGIALLKPFPECWSLSI